MIVLEGVEGNVGVDGSSELDGDIGWERSSARTTSAGVPPGSRSLKRRLSAFLQTCRPKMPAKIWLGCWRWWW
jgi:hypothetical protein